MLRNRIIYSITLIFLLTSCGGSWDSVKRGLTGEKKLSTDEFMVKKKDPLILPPDFESLPMPSDRREAIEEVSSFEKTLTKSVENVSESKASAEQSILKKIPKTSSVQETSSTTSSLEKSILKKIPKTSSTQGTSIASGSAEQSILQKIKKK
jgi:hypothetical protein